MQNHWSTPGVLLSSLRGMFATATEKFASPLNHDFDIPRYCSAHERDALFGAIVDAYGTRPVGSNYMNPEYEGPELYKALRHAMEETAGTAPVLTTLVYPRWEDYRYMALLPAPCVHVLCKMENFRFNPPDHYADASRKAGEANWPVMILVVANERGLREFATPDLQVLQGAADDIGARVTWLEEPGGRRSPGEQEGEFVPFTRPQKYYEKLRYDTNRPPEDCPQDWELARADAEGAWRWDRAMRAPPGTVYTDGSLTEAGAGAAIYHSGSEDVYRLSVPGTGPAVVLRAELTAIWQTLLRYERCVLRVLTDSLNSLLLIRRIMDRPHTVSGHEGGGAAARSHQVGNRRQSGPGVHGQGPGARGVPREREEGRTRKRSRVRRIPVRHARRGTVTTPGSGYRPLPV